MFPEFSFQATKSLFKKDPLHLSIFHKKVKGRDVTVVACKSPKKAQGFLRDVFFPTENGNGSRDNPDEVTMLTDPNHEKNIRLSSEPVHLGEAVRDDIRPQLRILIGHQDPVINQPGFHGSCHVRVLLPLLIWSTQQFFCVFVLGYHLLGSSSRDVSG